MYSINMCVCIWKSSIPDSPFNYKIFKELNYQKQLWRMNLLWLKIQHKIISGIKWWTLTKIATKMFKNITYHHFPTFMFRAFSTPCIFSFILFFFPLSCGYLKDAPIFLVNSFGRREYFYDENLKLLSLVFFLKSLNLYYLI